MSTRAPAVLINELNLEEGKLWKIYQVKIERPPRCSTNLRQDFETFSWEIHDSDRSLTCPHRQAWYKNHWLSSIVTWIFALYLHQRCSKTTYDLRRPMITIRTQSNPIPSVHPQSLFNHLNRPWIDLSRPPMTSNDWKKYKARGGGHHELLIFCSRWSLTSIDL